MPPTSASDFSAQPGAPAGSFDYPVPFKLFYQAGDAWVEANANSYCAPGAPQSAAVPTPQVPTDASFALEFAAIIDGNNKIVPDLAALRQPGTTLLRQRADVTDALSGFGMLRRITGFTQQGAPQYEAGVIPCSVDWAPGFEPAAIQDGVNVMRLVFNPRPGNSATAGLPGGEKYEFVFPQNLPSITFEY